MFKATQFMTEEVSYKSGYLWYYLPDFLRQWGEMEAYNTMIWMQQPGTISMGNNFLDAYHASKNEYYYKAAQNAASAIILGQSKEGGWNYMIDFAGDQSIKEWYSTIGKNGWRLEELQHYYGNSTSDDDVTSDAAFYLLQIYLKKLNNLYKPALNKAINFILESQYPDGEWAQRYPLKFDFEKQGNPDYTSFYTFNAVVIWENTHFLIQCYSTLGEERFLDPIQRGMNLYLISQDSCGAWGQQLNMNMEAAGARTYEPAAFLSKTTCKNALLLLTFYELTGDKKFIETIPNVINWLENTRLPKDKIEGQRTHPTYVDPYTNKLIYVHRNASNAKYGTYYVDDKDKQLLAHYYGKCYLQLDSLKAIFKRLLSLSSIESSKNSTSNSAQLKELGSIQRYYDLNRNNNSIDASKKKVEKIISSLDTQNRWLGKNALISNPYISEGVNQELTDKYSTTLVGDNSDTSLYRDTSNQKYISTREYIRNIKVLISYLHNTESSIDSQKPRE